MRYILTVCSRTCVGHGKVNRVAESDEGVGYREGVFPSLANWGSEERCELFARLWGRSPSGQRFSCILHVIWCLFSVVD